MNEPLPHADAAPDTCPACHSATGQVRAGRQDGRQRVKCTQCGRRYAQEVRARGYPETFRQQAAALSADGLSVARIARELGVSAQSVRAWQRGAARAEAGTRDREMKAAIPAAAPPGKKRPTITDVAREAGVSPSTVSNYLNRQGRMSEETRARIAGAIDTLHFTPSALVQSLRRQRTGILGVLIFGLNTIDENVGASLTPPLLAGVSEAADAAGHNLLLYTGWPNRAASPSGLEFLNGHVDGLVWVAPALHEPALERLAAAGLPVVALLTRHVPDGIGYVNADNARAVTEIVSHLAGLGHRRIAYLGSLGDSNSIDRRAGYRQGLSQHNIERHPAWEVLGSRTDAFVQKTVDTWLSLSLPPTAIVTANDRWAADVGAALHQRGRRVPEDMAVTGFNDIPDALTMFGGLTTARQPFHEMGRVAAQRLLALMEGAAVETCRVVLSAPVIVRASTGPGRADDAGPG